MWKFALVLLCLSVVPAQLRANGVSRQASCEELLANEWLNSVVVQNLNQLVDFPGQWALGSQQIMLKLITHFQNPNLDFAYFERFFRKQKAPLYLVANSQPLDEGLQIGYPHALAVLKGNLPPRYHLWVGVGAKAGKETSDLKELLGISDEENLRRLPETGFIMLQDEASLSDYPNIHPVDEETLRKMKHVRVRRPFTAEDN